nr:MAG TPA: hypothetical protein [Bacteriophage sp.]
MQTKSTKSIDNANIVCYCMLTGSTERSDYMSEREKQIVEKLKDAIPKMSDFDKGYILGKVENMAEQNQQSEHTDTENSRKE